ncbi:2-phosphoglycerate kinase-like protein [Drosera capensis]
MKEKEKEKGLMVMMMDHASPNGTSRETEEEIVGEEAARPSGFASRNASSKYDFVKVKVWLGDNADHYYVLSRFLLSRMLTVTKIPNHVAIKIALELKKLLIDNSLLDVFHHQRVPLVILVCGTACSGKSTIATQLAQRLNLPNVLQTDMVYELLRTSTDAPLGSTPVWEREFSSPEELITEFCRECRIVRKGLAGDLKKAMKDGKPIIIEGIHIDPSIYLMDDENKLAKNSLDKAIGSKDGVDSSPSLLNGEIVNGSKILYGDNHQSVQNGSLQETSPSDEVNKLVDRLGSAIIEEKGSEGGNLENPEKVHLNHAKKERSGAEPIIVPLVLKMNDFDHEALLEEWIATRMYKDKDKLLSNIKTIQDYLCKFDSQGLTVVNISATTFPQTLDWLHSYLLQCIEQGISAVSNGTPKQQAQD